MEHDETGFQPPPDAPNLCANNCGFFGSAANMNMCSKCYKDLISKNEQAKLTASSIKSLVSGCSDIESTFTDTVVVPAGNEQVKAANVPSFIASTSAGGVEPKPHGHNRCSTCNKRVGLMGFKCRCGNLFCGSHRYSDKHDCPFDYHTAGQNAIAKANPIVKADKLDKI